MGYSRWPRGSALVLAKVTERQVIVKHSCFVEVPVELRGIVRKAKAEDYAASGGYTHPMRLLNVFPCPHRSDNSPGFAVAVEFFERGYVINDHG